MKYTVPENLETQRLYLRMFRESDWKDLHDYYGNSECTKYTSRTPLKENETWQKLAALAGHWQLRGYRSYALEEKSTRKVVGIAGLDYPNDWPEPEIQWGLSWSFWGMGFASEAVREIKRMTSIHLPDLSLISLIHPENKNSIQLAKAVEARFEKQYFFRNEFWDVYRHF